MLTWYPNRLLAAMALVCLLSGSLRAQFEWKSLGPEGGDVRSLAYDPNNPDRIFLGTSAGQLYLSTDGGGNWARLARLGSSDSYVLDHILIDPVNPRTMYVSAWDVEREGGDIFRTRDGGRSWQVLEGMRGKAVRAMVMAPSDSRILVVGTPDGVFRTADGGSTWQRISPQYHAEIRNLRSAAIDPRDPSILYVGTSHLPWKTTDGGLSWGQMNQGIIDDSDVFSIVVDRNRPATVYASACSGIYKSENGGAQFRKVQGIPYSARRTRVLQQDPVNSNVVYAGTTEGLWKTLDAGATWKRMTAANYIVNDILIDPRNPERVLLATDRSGVLMSLNGGQTFHTANHGFSHRQVAAVLVDRSHFGTLYAGVINDKEFGGVFASYDGGGQWVQLSSGLGGRDIFALGQGENGALMAGTNRGISYLEPNERQWKERGTVLEETPLPAARKGRQTRGKARTRVVRTKMTARVLQLELAPGAWFAATSEGIFRSQDEGLTWVRVKELAPEEFIAVRQQGPRIVAATRHSLFLSQDQGASWKAARPPEHLTRIFGAAIGPAGETWLASREGGFRSLDGGQSWEHVLHGLPALNVTSFLHDAPSGRLLATAGVTDGIFESSDGGNTWERLGKPVWAVRALNVAHGRLLALTAFDGVIAPLSESRPEAQATGSGLSQ